jgi:hypothetical protein
MAVQYDFGFPVRRKLRLSEIEEILRNAKVIQPIPTRRYFTNKLEDGTLEGVLTEFGWLVYEDSFKAWVRSLEQRAA